MFMKKITILLTGALTLALLVAGCSDSGDYESSGTSGGGTEGGGASRPSGTTGGATPAKGSETTGPHPGLRDPGQGNFKAPDTFKVKFETTKGDFVLECQRALSPLGVDRFFSLVKVGYFDDCCLYRAVTNWVVQWGYHADPNVTGKWSSRNIQDDPMKYSNTRGTISFAKAGPNTRSTQVFINFKDNSQMLDRQGFSPFGRVVSGWDVVDKFNTQYGDATLQDARNIATRGNDYLKERWPGLDYIKRATLMP